MEEYNSNIRGKFIASRVKDMNNNINSFTKYFGDNVEAVQLVEEIELEKCLKEIAEFNAVYKLWHKMFKGNYKETLKQAIKRQTVEALRYL